MSGVTMERVVDKIRELEARIRALERRAEDDRTLDDIRTSITMLAESMANGTETSSSGSAKPTTANDARAKTKAPDFTALADPRFRVL